MSKKSKIQDMPYEQALQQLEDIVSELESGNLPLDKALAAFETGQEAAARCSDLLDHAELKLKTITATEDGEIIESDWQIEDEA